MLSTVMHDTRIASHVIGDAQKKTGLRQRAQLYCDHGLHLGELMADEAHSMFYFPQRWKALSVGCEV